MLQVDGLICFYITLFTLALAGKSLSSGLKSRDHIFSSDEVLSIMNWADCCLNLWKHWQASDQMVFSSHQSHSTRAVDCCIVRDVVLHIPTLNGL